MSRIYFKEFVYKGYTVPRGFYLTDSRADEIAQLEKKQRVSDKNKVSLKDYLMQMDITWRDAEGRKPYEKLTDREKMLEGGIPWNPQLLKEFENERRAS